MMLFRGDGTVPLKAKIHNKKRVHVSKPDTDNEAEKAEKARTEGDNPDEARWMFVFCLVSEFLESYYRAKFEAEKAEKARTEGGIYLNPDEARKLRRAIDELSRVAKQHRNRVSEESGCCGCLFWVFVLYFALILIALMVLYPLFSYI